jgi:NAD-dependent dihydropyrimidine dehydrogenase PreA subunit
MTQKVTQETYHGVPREKIPWGPTINYDKCISCGKCAQYCHMKVFTLQEKGGKQQAVVTNPKGCVVFCTGCESICPAGAITHPSKKETQQLIRQLQKEQKKGCP